MSIWMKITLHSYAVYMRLITINIGDTKKLSLENKFSEIVSLDINAKKKSTISK